MGAGLMRLGLWFAGAAVSSAIAVSALGAVAAPWKVDKAHSYVMFEIVHLGLIPYPGRFTAFAADLNFNPASIETSSVAVRIPVVTLETDNDLMNETLLSEQLFDVKNFELMEFKSTKITRTGSDVGVIEGDLTIKGNTRPVKMDAVFAGEAKDPIFGTPRIGFTASLEIDRTKWGLSAWRGFVDKTVTIRIGIEATPE